MPIIFYSWQSDRPNNINRGLIKLALEDAVESLNAGADIEDAVRLDHDTQNVPGSPDIVDTILQKIENCDVFIPDVTFVTDSEQRPCPNPNVMIEYGYALKASGAEKIIAVMNKHYGEPDVLPFDMRHRRFPLSYNLPPDADSSAKRAARDELSSAFKVAITAILENRAVPEPVQTPPFERKPSFDHGATFIEVNQQFPMVRGNETVQQRFPETPKMFLRLMPKNAVEAISKSQALEKITGEGISPLGSSRYESWNIATNRLGVCKLARHPTDEALIGAISQLHLNKEIWGVETSILSQAAANAQQRVGSNYMVIPTRLVKDIFIKALKEYIAFSSDKLQLNPPLIIIAGIVNIEGYCLALLNNEYSSPILDSAITKEILIDNLETPVEEILKPFFDSIYDAVGLTQPLT